MHDFHSHGRWQQQQRTTEVWRPTVECKCDTELHESNAVNQPRNSPCLSLRVSLFSYLTLNFISGLAKWRFKFCSFNSELSLKALEEHKRILVALACRILFIYINTVFQKTREHVFDNKLNKNCRFTTIFTIFPSMEILYQAYHLAYLFYGVIFIRNLSSYLVLV